MYSCVIVGCGLIAGGYDEPESNKVRTHAKAFQMSSQCKLVGVSDTSQERVNYFAKKWDVPFATNDVNKLFHKCKPDILSICTPTSTHKEIFELACSYGVSKIWLEKPAESRQSVLKMIEIAEKHKVEVWVNYFRRYDSGFKKIKERLSELGNIQHVQAYYTKGLRNNGSHLIDLIHWLFGKVNDVHVIDLIKDPDYPSMNGILYTDVSRIFLNSMDHTNFELFELDIIGSTGRITVKDGGQQILFKKVIDGKYYSGFRNLKLEEKHDHSYKIFMLAGIDKGLSKNSEMPGLIDEMKVQETLHRCSLATSGRMKF